MQPPRSLPEKTALVLTVCFAISLVATACISPPKPHVVIHEDPRGSVYLEDMPDGSFHATHPISLDSAVIHRVLRGVHVQEEQRVLQTLVAGRAVPVQAFSDEDTAFLARHITTALARATALQRVGFHVLHTTASGTEITGGLLYAYRQALHVSLTHYRHNPEKPSPGSRPGPQLRDPSGLAQHRVLFVPDSAQRPNVETSSTLMDRSPHLTVVVDYEALTRLPDFPPRPEDAFLNSEREISKPGQSHSQDGTQEPPSAGSEELRSMRTLIEKQTKELQALKEEVESLRRHQTEAQETPPKQKLKKQSAPHGPRSVP